MAVHDFICQDGVKYVYMTFKGLGLKNKMVLGGAVIKYCLKVLITFFVEIMCTDESFAIRP